MHMLSARPGGYVEENSGVITRLEQTPADIVILSAADSTLSLLASSHPQALQPSVHYPSVRLANLLHLRQQASVDLYVDEVLQHAKLILVDHLGGESYWPYGTEQLVTLSRRQGIALAMFSGDMQEDPNLTRLSNVDAETCHRLWRYLRQGGAANASQLYRFIGQRFFALDLPWRAPRSLASLAVFHPNDSDEPLKAWQQDWLPGAPVVALVFYRSHLQAGNTAVFAEMAARLVAHGLNPLPIALLSLKDDLCLDTLRKLCAEQRVQLILNTTAFAHAALDDPGEHALVGDVPVLQVMLSSADQDSWMQDPHGLAPRDMAMQVALPEVDGRIISRVISFKGLGRRCPLTQCDLVEYQGHASRMDFVAQLAQGWCRLRRLANADKRLALVLANYPTREGRLGNGVGLDTPASLVGILQRLHREGYWVDGAPGDGEALMAELRRGVTNDPNTRDLRPAYQSLALTDYLAYWQSLPAPARASIEARWGTPAQDPMLRQGRFMIAGLRLGGVFVGIQPSRGYDLDALTSYHDPDLPPPHYYLAFYCWLRRIWRCDAILHVGKHGSLEWLPGKSVALSEACWPDLIFGPLPHLYPFIVNDPGEGAQAKRRSQAVIIDHLMPPLTRAESYGPARDLELLIDEFYDALTLDPRRAEVLRPKIVKLILDNQLHADLGLAEPANAEDEQELFKRTDAYLCELKESQIRDGLHVFGQSPGGHLERDTLLALARYGVGNGQGRNAGLLRALAADLLGEGGFDPAAQDWSAAWLGPRPAPLQEVDGSPWRTRGDTRERLELLALRLLESPEAAQGWPATQAVLGRVEEELRPALASCGDQELLQLCRGLEGRFVPAGPSGAPSRGRPDVLPTGRNFFSVDTRTIPTPTAWALGWRSAELLIERYLQDEGEYPDSIGLSVWGTATMRTGGDDIAQAFALLGVRPCWADGSQRVSDFEVLPVANLGRPRVDVTLRVSGFFRDAFAGVMQLFDAAVQAVAELEEPAEANPIRARVLRESAEWQAQGLSAEQARRQAGLRVFGAKPGSYGAGLQGLMESGQWRDQTDLALAYLAWGGYAYGQGVYGAPQPEAFAQRLKGLQAVVQNQDNREHDLLDSDDYYQFQGGMSAAVQHLSGHQPRLLFGDHSDPESPRVRALDEEISRVLRARVHNPKWIAGVRRHGYKGAVEMAATVDYLFAFDATTGVVRDDQYARVNAAFLEDPETREFLQRYNPQALQDISERLLEAIQRGLWQASEGCAERLQEQILAAEQGLEE